MARRADILSDEDFIVLWETSDTIDRVVERIGEPFAAAGRQPMTRAAVLVRASNLRQSGAKIAKKRARSTERAADVERLNALIDQIRAGLEKGVIPTVAPLEKVEKREPPVLDPRPEIQKIIQKIREKNAAKKAD